ncbi:MAG: NYN domain-containing protein [Elusimicrobiota bacterium]
MSAERVVAFIDGQNLFHAARRAYGISIPDFDVRALSEYVCGSKGWSLVQTRFYTGVPAMKDGPFWHTFWAARLLLMSRRGVWTFTRKVRYRRKAVRLPDQPDFGRMAGRRFTFSSGEEKGIDVRIALDMIRLCHDRAYDIALLFSQDQDLSEAADEVRALGHAQGRRVEVVSAFPSSPVYANKRGIDRTDWIRIDPEAYSRCRRKA